jgi:hypothetical protein
MPDVGGSSDTQTEIAPGRTYLQVTKGSKKTFSLFDQPQKGRTFFQPDTLSAFGKSQNVGLLLNRQQRALRPLQCACLDTKAKRNAY